MNDPIELLFGGMGKLGPGDDAHTVRVLRLLPQKEFGLVVDAGCGTGRQTLALAGELKTKIHAVDTHQPFLDDLRRRDTGSLVETHQMDMRDIPKVFMDVDLLWSEGAAYNIGFADALRVWAPALAPGGSLVVSELCWLSGQPPEEAREFFLSGYPAMQSIEKNIGVVKSAGYELLSTHTLPKETWVEGYYDVLGPRAKALLGHEDKAVRDFARDTVREIEVFEKYGDSYGYVFFALRRPQGPAISPYT
jgi:SAM-dependent methyltransferase